MTSIAAGRHRRWASQRWSAAGDPWTFVLVASTAYLIVAYLVLGRSFAYLGVPRTPLFIGELYLATVVLARPRRLSGLWKHAARGALPLRKLAWALALVMAYGLFEIVRGMDLGYPPTSVLSGSVFNIYPVFFLIGIVVGRRDPRLPRRLALILAWANGLYGLLYVLVLGRMDLPHPNASYVPLFGQPTGSAIAILGILLLMPRDWHHAWLPLLLNSFVLLSLQVRAEWVGLVCALLALGWFMPRLRPQLSRGLVAIALLLSVMLLANVRLPAPVTRGEVISVRDMTARVVAPINKETALALSPDANMYAGTVEWRTQWWREIWKTVHGEGWRTAFGMGYGYPLTELVPYIDDERLRSPHNVSLFALAYGGWLGWAVFAAFLLAVFDLLWKVHRRWDARLGAFGIAVAVLTVVQAHFSNLFETPYGAIPFYLLTGVIAAQHVLPGRYGEEQPSGPQLAQNVVRDGRGATVHVRATD